MDVKEMINELRRRVELFEDFMSTIEWSELTEAEMRAITARLAEFSALMELRKRQFVLRAIQGLEPPSKRFSHVSVGGACPAPRLSGRARAEKQDGIAVSENQSWFMRRPV